MEAPNIMGLSFNTRNLGLAVINQNQLVDYSSKLHKSKWSLQKKDMILSSLVTCIETYNIKRVALSIPFKWNQTKYFSELLNAIVALFQMRKIPVATYSPNEIFLAFPTIKKRSLKKLIAELNLLYPELGTYCEKERNNKNKYYYKMFEAIGVASICSRKIGRWRN